MSHIFISYSHNDRKYVEKLEQKLLEEGFNVWIDHRFEYGSRWSEAIETAIDPCDGYIVVMSEDAKKSPWVQREVIHAEKRQKPFFPLLLEGEAWFSLGDIQFVDVRDGSLPTENIFKRLSTVTPRKKIIEPPATQPVPVPVKQAQVKHPPRFSKTTHSQAQYATPLDRQRCDSGLRHLRTWICDPTILPTGYAYVSGGRNGHPKRAGD